MVLWYLCLRRDRFVEVNGGENSVSYLRIITSSFVHKIVTTISPINDTSLVLGPSYWILIIAQPLLSLFSPPSICPFSLHWIFLRDCLSLIFNVSHWGHISSKVVAHGCWGCKGTGQVCVCVEWKSPSWWCVHNMVWCVEMRTAPTFATQGIQHPSSQPTNQTYQQW